MGHLEEDWLAHASMGHRVAVIYAYTKLECCSQQRPPCFRMLHPKLPFRVILFVNYTANAYCLYYCSLYFSPFVLVSSI